MTELLPCPPMTIIEAAIDALERLALLAGGDVNMNDPLRKWFTVANFQDAREALDALDAWNTSPALLPCQVSDAMIEAGEQAIITDGFDTPRLMVERIYTAMNKASIIPTDGEMVERDLATELGEAANLLEASGNFDLRDAVREAADRLSTIPSAGELREALKRIAWLRPAGDGNGVNLKDARRFLETMERIALDALGQGL